MSHRINYWRETQREPRFFFVDARICIFVLLAILHFRIWTILLLLVMTAILMWLESRGIRPSRVHMHILTCMRGDFIHARGARELRQYYNPGDG